MSPLVISAIVFACVFAGALVGLLIRTRLPDHHLSSDSKDLVKSVIGVVGTMTALVLGLLVASAKSSFDAQRNGVSQLAANVVVLDRSLALYQKESQGAPEQKTVQEARELLRASVADLLRRTWPDAQTGSPADASDASTGRYQEVFERVLGLAPKSDSQKTLHDLSTRLLIDTGQMRTNLAAQRQDSSIPLPFLVVMVLWTSMILASFGLLAPRNATAILSLALCALVVSSSLFLILELDHPFSGLMRISSQPLRVALEQLGQ